MVARQTPTLHKRMVLVTVFLLVAFALITYRLFSLSVVSGAYYRDLAENQYTLIKKLVPSRGQIQITDKFQATPYPVATNVEEDIVYAVPEAISDPKAAADSLAPILAMDPNDILSKISDKTKKYVPLKHQIDDATRQKIEDLKLPGISFDPETLRFYPEKNFLAQVLGFVGYNGDLKVGRYGLEQFFDKDLTGTAGNLSQEKDATGAWIFGAKRDLTPAVNGDNLLLTIDKAIQFKVETVLKDAVSKNGADSGSAIVMDPKTGAILAMATAPDFDPNAYNQVTDSAVYRNIAATGNYEPGSTFKALTMAAALEEGKVTPDSTFTDTGTVNVDNYTIKNAEPGARGLQTMTQVLDFSLNTGAIFAKEQIGNPTFFNYVKKFGFGQKTGIELPETWGNLDNLKANIAVNYDTASFGQGISVTPLQMVRAYGALANGGVMMKPFIVQAKLQPDGTSVQTKPQSSGQIISAKTASTISAMLVDVVERGFGKRAGVPGYYIAGKTGTAQVSRKDGKPGYEANDNIGSFIGYGPVEDPKFVLLVRIDHPRDVAFAESTAAPAWGQIAQFILNYDNVAPTRK